MPALTRDPNPLHTNGLSQPQRRLAGLRPAFWQADERDMTDLLQFATDFARQVGVRFYDEANRPDVGEAWQTLMDYRNYAQPGDLTDSSPRDDIPPHLALFVAFLHGFGRAQELLNTFTQKHLDYYYKEVLQLANRPPVADEVFVLFELAKNATEQLLPAQTELDAKKDAHRQPLTYKTLDPLTVNRASVGFLRSVFRDTATATKKIYHAPVANTADGVAKPLTSAQPFWNAFGPSSATAQTWPQAQLGFALASGVLRLAEGDRTITVTLTKRETSPAIPSGIKLRLELSGEKSWVSATDLATLSESGNTLTFSAKLGPDRKEAIVDFDPAVLDGGYATTQPVLRCWLNDTADYDKLQAVQLTKAEIKVEVKGLKKTLTLENDLGPVSPDKPFMPFGSSPTVGSVLYVGCAEAVGKTLSTVKVSIPDWVGLPTDWSDHYAAYPEPDPAKPANPETSYKTRDNFTATTSVINGNLKTELTDPQKLFSPSYAASVPPATHATSPSSLSSTFFIPFLGLYNNNYVVQAGQYVQLQVAQFASATAPTATRSVSDALLRVTLDKDFGHQRYPKLLTEGILADPKNIPNAPYTPVAKELTLDYTASTQMSLDTAEQSIEKFAGRGLQLIHLGPFGQAEEHPFLKQSADFLDNKEKAAYLLPQFGELGTLLLGLHDVGPGEAVSLLILAAEGSANPEQQPATVVWSVLVSNQWRILKPEERLSDSTNHLLTSGIVKLLLPAETTTDNTLLGTGCVWLRAELRTLPTNTAVDENPFKQLATSGLPAPPDSVADWRAVHTQAALARFVNAGNDPAHADAPLPAQTIQKLRQPVAAIKAVQQPAPSIHGQPAETDDAFYTRVSERLRHKNRAVSGWDYEHLVLQAFPSVYKAECLRHSRLDDDKLNDLAPGFVLLVVVPDWRGGADGVLSEAERLQPKVDLNTLTAVTDFLQQRMGKLLTVKVINSVYEKIKIGAKVAFKPGFEYAPYARKLNQDLIGFLAPWSQQLTADIPFDGTLTKSDLIAFAERLPYVDFLTEVTLQHLINDHSDMADTDTVRASDARAVLTSVAQHELRPFDNC